MNFDRYVGIPWLAGGRDFDGVDCWGLVWLFHQNETPVSLPCYSNAYDLGCAAVDISGLIETQLHQWQQTTNPKPGNVVLINRSGVACHVGVYAPGHRLLHVECQTTASVIVRITGALRRRIVGVYRQKSG